MNIYLMNEDGATFCIKAPNMAEAVKVCEASFLKDREAEDGDDYDAEAESHFYHENVLYSCALVGELKN